MAVLKTPYPNPTPNRTSPPGIFPRSFFLCHVSSQTSKPQSFVLTHIRMYCSPHLTSQLNSDFHTMGVDLFYGHHLGPFQVTCHCFRIPEEI